MEIVNLPPEEVIFTPVDALATNVISPRKELKLVTTLDLSNVPTINLGGTI